MVRIIVVFTGLSLNWTVQAANYGRIVSAREIAPSGIVFAKGEGDIYRIIDVTGGASTAKRSVSKGQLGQLLDYDHNLLPEPGEVMPEPLLTIDELNRDKQVTVEFGDTGAVRLQIKSLLHADMLGVSSEILQSIDLQMSADQMELFRQDQPVLVGASPQAIRESYDNYYAAETEAAAKVMTAALGPMFKYSGVKEEVQILSKTKVRRYPKFVSCEFWARRISCKTDSAKIIYKFTAVTKAPEAL